MPVEEEKVCKIEAKLAAKLNLADFRNAVPMLREMKLVNGTDADMKELELRLDSSPAFVQPKIWHIEAIGSGEEYAIPNLDVQLDGALLTRLTEAETATVTLSLRARSAPDAELAHAESSVELLPRNQWGGLSHLPDLLAAFVQPNDPAIEHLLKQAAEILSKNGKNPALDGYKGGAKRAWELASGIWSAVCASGITYALPPASFEHTGQKVRGPSQIADVGLATCLDLSLLFCSALEQAGLNPLVVFTKGHAFSGVWLKAEEFSTTVVDDVTALRKRVKLKELVLFETTLAASRPAPTFSYAAQHAAGQIGEGKDEDFELAVDIRRARMQRIKPLASAEASTDRPHEEIAPVAEPVFDEAPDLPSESIAEPDPATLNPKDRLARWQRKLLDLSLRNNLLNFRGGKKALKLEAPDPSLLEDVLSDGQALRLMSRPDLMDGADPRDQAIYESREHEDVRRTHAMDALKRREIFVSVTPDELDSRLVDLYRTARTTLQEGGANTLYLALGFLTWTRDDKAGTKYKAPLVLVPVTLNRKSARSGFTLTLHDDEPRFNPTLIEMLRQDHMLNLGVADGDLPKDEHGLDVHAVWKSVSHAIKDIKGWEVSEEVVLAMFSFAKYLMWKDLTERTEQLRENAVVRHLIDTPRDAYASTVGFTNPKNLDDELRPEATFCPLPADSSQLSAVLAAARGKDFVLIGPPGTGKSQTIANLIAQCLAEGKRVLFVSEKIAALDVVYRRLREVGLGEFCLELHSSKARKLDVLAQLQKAWEAQGKLDPDVWRSQAEKLKRLRDDLNVYVERLHKRYANGLTIYEAIGCLAAGEDVTALGLSWNAAGVHDKAAMESLRAIVDRLDINAKAVGSGALTNNPLGGVCRSEWTPAWQQSLVDAARGVVPAARELEQAHEDFAQAIKLPRMPLTSRLRGAVAILARTLPDAAGYDWRFALRPDAKILVERLQAGASILRQHHGLSSQLTPPWSEGVMSDCRIGLGLLGKQRDLRAQIGQPWPADVVEELTKGIEYLQRIEETSKQLSVQYSDAVEQLNVAHLQREWAKAEKAVWPLSWLGKRKIRAALETTVSGDGVPDVEKDIRLLCSIRGLRAQADALEIGPATEGIWVGLKTRVDFAQVALRFQGAWLSARQGGLWDDQGYDHIANGRCGAILAAELGRLREIHRLDVEIAGFEHLRASTTELWQGVNTKAELVDAAIRFNKALLRLAESGPLDDDHDAVACGDCGPGMAADFQRLRQRSALEHQIAAVEGLAEMTNGVWSGLHTHVEVLEKAMKFHAAVSMAVATLGAAVDIASIKTPLMYLLGEGNALLEPTGPVPAAAVRYLETLDALQPKIDQLAGIGEFSEASKAEFADSPLSQLVARCQAIVQAESRLHAWCAWRNVWERAVVIGLAPLVAAIEGGAVGPGSISRTFETNYCRWWLNAVVEHEDVIRTFVSAEHERRIGDFRALDKSFTDTTRAWVRASLCADLPQQDAVTRNSEWGILRHEMSKKKRHLPLRELMTSIPTALTKLTPCLLMSPLSVAQYLAADATTFDLVVFDEASQIPVWDAIGAIARGRQVVMVGDPKQLPPTNFFDRAESSADEEDNDGDLESILDECMGANLPTMNLAWHYRSRNESLIAFSNHRYYGGSLVTFPSPVTDDRAVSLHAIKGIYEKGGARVNKPEAKALVADIVARLRSPGFKESRLTIGVVTFNAEQQTLIEDLLDEERRRDPALEPYFSEFELEPLFVKNLESVQGDERDIMYFSITYGPDLAGAVSMNFGPMNREGGERRLNVAITRARVELRVFSSIKAEQFDLNRTKAIGVRDLKHFLEFAERGPRALAEVNRGSLGGFESPFEEAVAASLAGKGWELHTQIGASAFRVDLAVVHPDARGIYLTGIECDGATYHRSATARDRDLLREQVLRGLGWEILRVWSTDWWIDRSGTLERLDQSLKALLVDSRAVREREAGQEAARAAAEAAIVKAQEEAADLGRAMAARTEKEKAEPQGTGSEDRHAELAETYARNASTPDFVQEEAEMFIEADPKSVVDLVDPEAFYQTSYGETLAKMVAHIVEVEGPVLDAVLARRIARAHGWQRTGSRIQDHVEAIAARNHRSTEEEVGTFYWPTSRAPEAAIGFRRSQDESARAVDEICMPELLALAREVLAAGKIGEVGIVAMARELGLQRLRGASRGRFEKAMDAAQAQQ